MDISKIVAKQKAFFDTGKTLDVNFRIAALKRLKKAIIKHEDEINEALKKDLGKSAAETYMCETGMTLSELSYQLSHVRKWSRNQTKPTSMANFHAKSFTVQEPYGCVLIMSPWNYPFMLCLEPMVGAIAAGNCCVLKPSAYSPATSAVIKQIISEIYPEKYVAVVEGGRAENTELLNQNFDYIFFTGGVTVGKLVMEKAAAHLTPVTLELGGKSPCIIDSSANLKLAAKRLVFGKYLNCGQTCVVPDYVLVDEKVKDEFVALVRLQIRKQFGTDPLLNPDYGKIINQKHFDRLTGLIAASSEKVICGGNSDPEALRIAPTVMVDVTPDDAVMQEEIFGPIMPILTYHDIREAERFIKEREKPLALYIFTSKKSVAKRFVKYVSFGGGCINDTVLHLATSEMGFGGVGGSGMGAYHGRKSFETFSHEKSILKKYTWIDMPMRYQPYKKIYMALTKMFLR
ncbi:MAG: aldehyde dehydrogenase [Lachnospiraceae bacterium]|nr:aldehyde dehydrogenase [Lachnospiraceae bacterium]